MRNYKSKGRVKAYLREKYETPEGRATYLISRAKKASGEKGIPCTITRDDILSRIQRGFCEATGVAFRYNYNGRANPFAPSLDQINPSQGYTPENIQVVIWLYNAAKNDWSHDDVVEMARGLVSREDGYFEIKRIPKSEATHLRRL